MSTNYEIDFQHWRKPKPHGISACIRVRNEAQFMRAAVLSIVDLVDEVVLCTQPSDDETPQIALELSQAYDHVRVCYYPFVVDWIDTPEFYAKDPDQMGHLVHMSNWALSKCSYSWILKVEGDVIALPALEPMVRAVLDENKAMYYGLVILNVAGVDMDMISLENPRNGGWDEAIFPNDPDKVRFHRSGKWEVAVPQIPRISLGWALLHMKRCKTGKDNGWNGERYIPWTDENVRLALERYNGQNGYPATDGLPLGFRAEVGKAAIAKYGNYILDAHKTPLKLVLLNP